MTVEDSLKAFFKRQSILPFEVTFAAVCIFQGVLSLFGIGLWTASLSSILGGGLAAGLNSGLSLSGILIYFGIGLNRRGMDAAGCVLAMTTLIVRNLALLLMFGLTPVLFGSFVYASAFAIACFFRLRKLVSMKVLAVEITPDGQ